MFGHRFVCLRRCLVAWSEAVALIMTSHALCAEPDDSSWHSFGVAVYSHRHGLGAVSGSLSSNACAISRHTSQTQTCDNNHLSELNYLKKRAAGVLDLYTEKEDRLLQAHIIRNRSRSLSHGTLMSGMDLPWQLALRVFNFLISKRLKCLTSARSTANGPPFLLVRRHPLIISKPLCG